ncbi:UNVERIFIED_CONTAM: hypothetical protein NCL1_29020 [Trichonephila clavipes]
MKEFFGLGVRAPSNIGLCRAEILLTVSLSFSQAATSDCRVGEKSMKSLISLMIVGMSWSSLDLQLKIRINEELENLAIDFEIKSNVRVWNSLTLC